MGQYIFDTETERIFFAGGGGEGRGGAGGYNSAFIPDRGTEQQVKINGQVGLFTEGGGQLRKYSNFSEE